MVSTGAFAHDVTITGTQTFASLDGSSSDHDGAVNGVFTVSDGNLVVNGVVSCNDDTTTSACSMAFVASGDITVNSGGALYAENRSGGGTGGAILLTAGGNVAVNAGGVVSSSSRSSSGATGGNISANAGGVISVASGGTIDSGSANAQAGKITLTASGLVSVDGNVLSGPSRTILATRLNGGAALDGGTSNQAGGEITIASTSFIQPAVVVGTNANIVSQGETNGAGPVTITGCGIEVRGLVAALAKKDAPARISIRSGQGLLIDGRDLGVAGATLGRTARVRADAPTGTASQKGVDLFAAEGVQVLGPAAARSTLYVITSMPGVHDAKSFGGLIRILSTGDAVTASGNVADSGRSNSGDTGGTIEIAASGDVNLATAVIRAVGDFSTNNPNRGGGSISVRSYSGDVIWTNGLGEVRPTGSNSGLPTADQGVINLTACGSVTTTGTSFPVMGTPTFVFPNIQSGVCSPAAPSLPAGVPPFVTCNNPPVANDASASTNEEQSVTITLSGSDVDGDPLTFSIVSGPSNGSLGAIVPVNATSATVDYTPNADYNGGDSFVYQANDGNGGTDNATVTITIAAVNDAPSFQAGTDVTSLEDGGPQTFSPWATSISAGPADESGQTVTFSVTGNSNPSLFSVPPAVSGTGDLTYTSATNVYGSATITIIAQDNGGTASGAADTSASQSFTITVQNVNDAPSFTGGADQTVNEDAGAQSVANWATAISAGPNEGSQSLSFTVTNSNASLFSAAPAVSPSGTLTYTPAADANGTATVTVVLTDDGGTANGGVDTSASYAFTITVNAVNDAPSFTSGGDVTVLEDSGAYSAAWATAISAGPADESGQTVSFNTSNSNNGLFSVQPSIDATGTLSFTVAADAHGTATVTVTLSDNGGTANGGVDTSAAQTFTVTVSPVNDAPSFTAGADQTVNEDSGAHTVANWATGISAGPNESGQTLTFNVTGNTNASLFSAGPSIAADGTLSYTLAANANGSATITITLSDDGGTANGGNDTSAAQSFTITVTAVNDAPSFVGGGNVSALEDSGAQTVSPWATSISAGPADEAGQTLSFAVTANSNPALFSAGPAVAADGTLTYTAAADAFGSATITVVLSDNGGTANGGADTSAAYTFTITINPVNDAPSFTAGGNVTVNEDGGAYSQTWATGISAGPNEGGQTVAFSTTNSNNALFSAQPSISPAGVLTFTAAANAFGTATVTVSLSDNGGTANGGIDTSAAVTFTITVNGVNDAPTAGNDAWETEGNTELRVDLLAGLTPHVADTTPSGTGVLDNDTDTLEGDSFSITSIVGCADTIAPFDCTFGDGSKLSMQANGSFSFVPGPGATSGSFQYVVTDNPSAGAPASATGTVTITVHDQIWYVKGGAVGGNGTSVAPYGNFTALNGGADVDAPGAYIFVHTSGVNGSIALETNQRFWGEGIGLVINRNLNGNGAPTTLVAAGVRPTVTSTGDTVSVSNVTGVEIAGFNLSSGTGNAVDVTSSPLGSNAAGASIYSNVVVSAAAEGIDVNGGGSLGTTVNVNNTSITSTGNGFNATSMGGDVAVSYSNGTISSVSGIGISFDGSAGGNLFVTGLNNVTVSGNTASDGIRVVSATFDAVPGGAFNAVSGGNVVVGAAGNGVGAAGVVLSNVSGAYALGSLSAWSDNGAAAVITGSGSGFTVTSGGGTLSAVNGAGLSVANATIGAANLSFTSISSTGAANGIVLNNTGSLGGLKVLGTGSASSGGTIQSTGSHGVLLTNTASPAFNNLRVLNTSGSGVKGTQVAGFAFTNGSIDNSGTGLGLNESNIAFNSTTAGTESNLSGVVAITGNTLTNAYYHGVDIWNFDGSLSNVVVSNNTITSSTSTATSKGSAIRLSAFGSASTVANVTKATIDNNVITNFPSGAGIMAQGGNANSAGTAGTLGTAGSASDIVAITNNRIAGQSAANRIGTNAILTSVNGKGQGNFNISGNGTAANPLANVSGNVIGLSAFGQVVVTGTVNNNIIVANHTAGAGGALGISVGASSTFAVTDAPSLTVTVSGNSISNTDGNGILVAARSSNAVLRSRVLNNIVAAPLSGLRPGIRVDSGTTTGNTNVCLEIAGNTSAGNGGTQGIGLRKQGTSAVTNVFGITGMAATSSPAVEAYVDSMNPAGGGTLLLSATSGFTGCTLP